MLRVGRFVCGENCFSQSRRFQKELWTILVKKREKTLVVVLNNLMLSKQQQENVAAAAAKCAKKSRKMLDMRLESALWMLKEAKFLVNLEKNSGALMSIVTKGLPEFFVQLP